MARYDLSETERRLIEPLLPNKPRGVARVEALTSRPSETARCNARSTLQSTASLAFLRDGPTAFEASIEAEGKMVVLTVMEVIKHILCLPCRSFC
jgi:hypothetical protein